MSLYVCVEFFCFVLILDFVFPNFRCECILLTRSTLAGGERLSALPVGFSVRQKRVSTGCRVASLCPLRSLELTFRAAYTSHHLHAASVKTSGGEKILPSAVIRLPSFCFPVSFHCDSGIQRGRRYVSAGVRVDISDGIHTEPSSGGVGSDSVGRVVIVAGVRGATSTPLNHLCPINLLPRPHR